MRAHAANIGKIIAAHIAIIMMPTLPALADDKTVRVWFSSFIPRENATVKDFSHKTLKGTWVIRAPDIPSAVLVAAPQHIKQLSGTCFSTDDRMFESSPSASARVKVDLTLKFSGRREFSVMKSVGKERIVEIGKTRNVNCETGEDIQPPKQAKIDSVTIGDVRKNSFLRIFNVNGSAGDPFYTLLDRPVAPRLDFDVIFEYNSLNTTLSIKGSTGVFPAFDGYYQVGDGPIKSLFQLQHGEGTGPFSLLDLWLGFNSRNFETKIELKDLFS